MYRRRRFLLLSSAAAPLLLPHVCGETKKKTVPLTFSDTQTVDVLSFQTRHAKVGVRGLKKAKITGVNLTLHRLSHELPGPVSFLLVAADGSNPNGEWTLHVYNANASDPG